MYIETHTCVFLSAIPLDK